MPRDPYYARMARRGMWVCAAGIAVELVAFGLAFAAVIDLPHLAVLLTVARIGSWANAACCAAALNVMSLLMWRRTRRRSANGTTGEGP